MNPRLQELRQVLLEANFAPWESVSSILGQSGPRAEHLKAHILETKRTYWALIGSVVAVKTPPETLPELLEYELEMLEGLQDRDLDHPLEYCNREMTVGGLIRLSARHSVWHAGQVAFTGQA